MKSKLLSFKEVSELLGSYNKYYIVSTNTLVPNGIYSYTNTETARMSDADNLHSFNINSIAVKCGDIKIYEYEEDIKVKEYKGWEILKMIDDGELKPKDKILINNDFEIYVDSFGILRYSSNGGKVDSSYLSNVYKFTIVEESPVTFIEAIKAFSEGKDIKCKILGDTYTYKIQGNCDDELGYILIDYVYGNPISTKEILEGKWYIEN